MVPPSVVVRATFPGANPKVIVETVATPIEEQINGVEGMLYMSSRATTDGIDDPDRHLPAGHRSRQGAAARPEPRLAGRAAPAGRGAPAGHRHGEELPGPNDGRASRVAERALRHDLPAQLRGAEHQGPPGPARRRRPGPALRLRRLRDADLARPAEGGRARPVRGRRRARDPGPERGGRGRRDRRVASRPGPRPAALAQRRGTPEQRGAVRRHRGQDRHRRRDHPPARRRADRARRLRLRPALAPRQQVGGGDPDLPIAGLERDPDLGRGPPHHGGDQADHARGRRLPDRLRPDAVRARLHRGRDPPRCWRPSPSSCWW